MSTIFRIMHHGSVKCFTCKFHCKSSRIRKCLDNPTPKNLKQLQEIFSELGCRGRISNKIAEAAEAHELSKALIDEIKSGLKFCNEIAHKSLDS